MTPHQNSEALAEDGKQLAPARCTLFTAVRNEAPFLLEWVAYHKVIGCDRIVVVSNDCTDGTSELLDALHAAGEVYHVAQTVGPDQRAQGEAARIANEQGLLEGSDWAIWLDADEFLNIHVGRGHVEDLIEAIGPRHGALLHWRLFGDGGNKRFDGRFLSEAYTDAHEDDTYLHLNLKTFFRFSSEKTALDMVIHRPALAKNAYTLDDFVTGSGSTLNDIAKTQDKKKDPMEFWYINGNWLKGDARHKVRGVMKYGTFGHELAQINHYAVRTPEYYALKVRRGNGFTKGRHGAPDTRHGDKYYTRYNGKGTEDHSILRHMKAVDYEMKRLQSLPTVAAAASAAEVRTNEQLQSVPPEEIAHYERLSSGGETPAAPPASSKASEASKLSFGEISKNLKAYVSNEGLDQYVKAAWVYKNIFFVMNFTHNSLVFGLTFKPTDQGGVDINLVDRDTKAAQQTGLKMNPEGTAKVQLASGVSLKDARDIVKSEVARFLSLGGETPVPEQADAQISKAGPHPDEALWADGKALSDGAKRVGVITLPLNDNIGGNLQALAMMETLKTLGHQPVFLNRRATPKDFDADYDREGDHQSPLLSKSIGLGKTHPTAPFIDQSITPISRPFFASSQLTGNLHRYHLDAVVAGSDQVWDPQSAGNTASDMFLGFIPEEDTSIKRISYAASFGLENLQLKPEMLEEAKKLLPRFDAISVREDSAVGICREVFGKKAAHSLDPTLLLNVERYKSLFAGKPLPACAGGMATYIVDPDPDKIDFIGILAEYLSLPAHSVSGLPNATKIADGDKPDLSVQAWLSGFYHSEFVATDSFHGVAFAILFNRPFIAFGNTKRGIASLRSVLKLFDLENRLVTEEDVFDLDKALRPIDWDAVNRKLAQEKKIALNFLQMSLTGRAFEAADNLALTKTPSMQNSVPIDQDANHPMNVLCTGCGVCVSESKDTLKMAWNSEGFRAPVQISANIPKRAIQVCPFNPHPQNAIKDEDVLGEEFLGDAHHFDPSAGYYEKSFVGFSKKFRSTSSSGGLGTYVFDKLLSYGIVEHLFIVREAPNGEFSYQIFNDKADIQATSKTRYFPVSMEKLFEEIDQLEGRVAVSGVACFIKAIRLKQHYNPALKAKIPFLVGMICGGLKSRNFTKFLAQSAGVEGDYTNVEYRLQDAAKPASDDAFSALDAQGKTHTLGMKSIGDVWGSGMFNAKACDFCTDITTELADISLGDAWLPDSASDGMGYNVVIARTGLASALIQAGIASNELEMEETPVNKVVLSQREAVDHKRRGVKFRTQIGKKQLKADLPNVRKRVLDELPVGDVLVQILRERVRAKSHSYWAEAKDVHLFNRLMNPSRQLLESMRQIANNKPDYVSKVAVEALNDPAAPIEVGKDVKALGVMLRWVRLKRHLGQITSKDLTAYIDG